MSPCGVLLISFTTKSLGIPDQNELHNNVRALQIAVCLLCDRSLRSELDEAKSEIAVTGCVRENLVELERQKTSLATELETMRQLLTESHDEATVARTVAEHELAKTQVGVCEGENLMEVLD